MFAYLTLKYFYIETGERDIECAHLKKYASKAPDICSRIETCLLKDLRRCVKGGSRV